MKKFEFIGLMALGFLMGGCNSDDNDVVVDPPMIPDTESLIVVNAGNYGSSNASITRWSEDGNITNELFQKVNGFKLGDTAQSATVNGDKTWIVVNNSNIIFAVNSDTFQEVGRIDEGLLNPRYIHFISDEKAYVTQMNSNQIAIVNPKTFRVTGYIDVSVPDGSVSDGSTEEMVQIGNFVYVNMWSYGNTILQIDTKSNEVVGKIKVGIQPYSMATDSKGNLWVLCDGGGWGDNPAGYEMPSVMCIDLRTMTAIKSQKLPLGDSVSKLAATADGSRLYFIQNHYNEDWTSTSQIVEIDTREDSAWANTIVTADDKTFYSLTVSPITGDIFAGDAVDYQQAGVVYRYSPVGKLLSSFTAGIIPTSYAWIIK